MKHKNLIRLAVFVISMQLSLLASAQPENVKSTETENSFRVRIQPEGTVSFRMFVENPSSKKLDITVIHSLNGVVADTTIDKTAYTCKYNFESAEDGRYIVIVSNGKEKFKQEIELNTVTTRNIRID